MSLNVDVSGLASLGSLLNGMALLIALCGAWLLLATRYRQQIANREAQLANSRVSASAHADTGATRRIDRFFNVLGLSSLALAWLLSSLTRLI